MDDVLYDGTGLPPEDTEELEQAPGDQEPTPEPAAPENPQSDGDGPPYEGGANLSGPAAGTGTDNPDAVAVPNDDRTPSEVEADKNAAENSGDIASGAYVEGADSLTGSATPLDAPAPFDPEQSEQQPT